MMAKKSKRVRLTWDQWAQYLRFKEILPQLEEAVHELEHGLEGHFEYLAEELQYNDPCEDLCDEVARVRDLVRMIRDEDACNPISREWPEDRRGDSWHLSNPIRSRPQIAEIIIEECGDEL